MVSEPPLLLVLDLTGTFAFAVNGALTALRLARLDIVGVITLGIITAIGGGIPRAAPLVGVPPPGLSPAIGGGIIRDVLIGSLPPATFSDWRSLAVAAGGGLVAFLAGRRLDR